MCEQEQFNFSDLNLDFLDWTPPQPTQGAPKALKCSSPPIPNIQEPPAIPISETQKNRTVKNLAKRIANIDNLVLQIKELQKERTELQQQLKEFQVSATEIRNLYEEEKQERQKLQRISNDLRTANTTLSSELTQKTLCCDQLQSQVEEAKRGPLEYDDLVIRYLRLSSKLDEERQLHWSCQGVAEKLKKYCSENSLPVPEKRSPKKRQTKITKSDIDIQCEIWKKEPHSTPHTAVAQKKEMRSQGTQHISITTTRSTSTSSFIQKHNVGTSFPEQAPLPPFDDMLKEMLTWEIVPMSPLCDLDPPPISTKSTGTCTLLCNIQKPIDFIGGQTLLASIKRSNSRPPSRNMLESIKNETITPPPIPPSITSHFENQNSFSQFASLNSNTFEDLWQVFGQMVYSLLKNRCDVHATRPSGTGDALSQQEFQHWLRSIYDDLPLPATGSSGDSTSGNDCINQTHQNKGRPNQQSIGTSPIRLSSTGRIYENNLSQSEDEIIYQPIATNSFNFSNPNLNTSSSQEMHKIRLPASELHTNNSAFKTPSKSILKTKKSKNKKTENVKDYSTIVNEILKLFPTAEPSYETKIKIMKLLGTKHKTSKKSKSTKKENAESKNSFYSNSNEVTENAVEFLCTLDDFAQTNTENYKNIDIESLNIQQRLADNNFSNTSNDQTNSENHNNIDIESLNIQNESKSDNTFSNVSDRIFRKPKQYVKSQKSKKVSKLQLKNLFGSDEEMDFDSDVQTNRSTETQNINDTFTDTELHNNTNNDVEICKILELGVIENIRKNCETNSTISITETCENESNDKTIIGKKQIDLQENIRSVEKDSILVLNDECNLIIDESVIEISTKHTNTQTESTLKNESGTCESIGKIRTESNKELNMCEQNSSDSDEMEYDKIERCISKTCGKPEYLFEKNITDDVIVRNVSCSSTEDVQFEDYLDRIIAEVTPRSLSPISLINSIATTEHEIITETSTDRLSIKSKTKNRGCKRKFESQCATTAVACKRSERLRAKQQTADIKVTPSLLESVKLGKYTKRHDQQPQNDRTENSRLVSNEESNEKISLEINMGFFRERPELRCDETDVENVNSNKMLNELNDLISDKKSTYNEPLTKKSFMETNGNPSENFSNTPHNIYDIQNAKITVESTLNIPEVPMSKIHIHEYDSPASPPHIHSSCDDLNTTSIRIPLEVDISQYSQQNYSLLQKMINSYSNSLYKSIVESNSKFTSSHKNITELKTIIHNFLEMNDTDPDSSSYVVLEKIQAITTDTSQIMLAIVLHMQEVPRPESELNCSIENVPPKYLGKRHRKIALVMRRLQQMYPHFSNELMALIEKTLFNFNTNERITLPTVLNLTQLYLLTISNQLPNMKTNPARLFIAKCLYYYNLKAIPMIYEVLCCFPTTLPHREERAYDRSDPLINVIIHILMSTKYDMDKADLRTKELLSKLRFEYHFEPFKPNRSEMLTNLIEKIKSGKLENISYSFALFCKRLPQQKAEIEILQAHLMPLANEFYQIALNSSSHDKHISCLIESISMIVKPFSVDTNISVYLSIFSRFLNVSDRQEIQEAAVQAIIRCQRFGYVNCYTELTNFKPNYELKPLTKVMLQTFIYRKPLKFWKTLKLQSDITADH